jgi:hypothetical protein
MKTAKAPPKGHPPKTPLEKGMVVFAKKNDLKNIEVTKNKGKNY